MSGLVGLALIILVRVILSADGSSGTLFNRPWVISLTVRAGLVFAALAALRAGHPAWTLICLAFAFPLVFTSLVLVPAGMPHVTYYFTRFVRPHSIAEEAVGGATFHELQARLNGGSGLTTDALRPLAKRLLNLFDGTTDRTVRGATVTARGILDALEGNWNTARELFDVVQDMRAWHAPHSARSYCQAWLLADAARRGAYHDVVRLSSRGPATRRRAFLRACSLRLLGRPKASSDLVLVLLWLAAPARRAHRSLLEHALAARHRDAIEVRGSDLTSVTAATVHLMRLARGTATRGEIWRVARAWQSVFESDELTASFVARRDALEANFRVQGLEAALAQGLTELFAGLLGDTLAEDPEGEEPPLVTAAKDMLQSDLLGELESLAEELPTDKSNRLDGYERHWHAWAHLRAIARRYLDALPERRAAVYDAVGATLLNHGAWLHNSEEGVLLAHDIFRYLLTLSPSTAEDYATLQKNAAIGRSL